MATQLSIGGLRLFPRTSGRWMGEQVFWLICLIRSLAMFFLRLSGTPIGSWVHNGCGMHPKYSTLSL
jgi:hypothetical protein